MSFSSDVKKELAQLLPNEPCCFAAQAYGLLECGRSFSASSISLHTENSAVCQAYQSFIKHSCCIDNESFEHIVRTSGINVINVHQDADRIKILNRFGHSLSDITIRLNRANFECEQCAAAYIRGAFLSCGALTDPNTDYHMEFSIPYYRLSLDIMALMGEMSIHVRLVRRKGIYIIYLKESGQIEDCLTLMGATNASLEIMGVKIIKDIRNTANRIANCENANIDKTVAASLAQITAIRIIQQRRGLDSLPDELRELAELRLNNPDLSLREMGELLPKPLSRSGVNHRLKRIIEISKEL
ncbi:MAG TPA: DNA-binding protein WhiA [Ruminococcaceae bacterium]|nr:DNA-binding protein WhiA [Oscillospiraceae bacterium]HCA30141.1 DNA-binding protein WhiA [Oscillospiraceae bacterium]